MTAVDQQDLNLVRTRPDMTNMILVAYSYARVSKSDCDDRHLETQIHELANHGIREELIFSDVMTGCLMSRPGSQSLRMGAMVRYYRVDLPN